MTMLTIRNILRDESPKSMVYVYSVKNQVVFPYGKDELEQEAIDHKKKLVELNQTLFYSDNIFENIDLLVPFDKVSIGSNLLGCF